LPDLLTRLSLALLNDYFEPRRVLEQRF
jgi:hypothetical protein